MRWLLPTALATALFTLLTLAGPASAQDPGEPVAVPPAAPAGVDDDGGFAIPSVDDPDAVRALLPAEQRLVDLTIGLYDAILAWGEGPCDQMWRPARTFLDAHEAEIEAAALELAARAETMAPEELEALGAWIAAEMAVQPSVHAAQATLYRCLRSADAQGKGRPLEKEMRRFFRLQEPMIDAIVGDVE